MSRLLSLAATLASAAALSGLSAAYAEVTPIATAMLQDAQGNTVGAVVLREDNGRVNAVVAIAGLPAGDHGFHIHSVGQCMPSFTAAGPHLNPGGKQHGFENSDGPHLGDLPNLHVPPEGHMTTVIEAKSLSRPGLDALFDQDGSALVVHTGRDDYKSQPSGNSGPPIACGVLRKGSAIETHQNQ